MLKNAFYCVLCLALTGCIIDDGPVRFPVGTVEGYRPIYGTEEQFAAITFTQDEPLINPGKIYVYGQYLLVSERGKGVHIYNNSDPTSPLHLGFINIYGNADIALKGNTLYADHGNDLVAINIANISNPIEVDRQEDIYDKVLSLPPADGNYFECVDKARGHLIVRWEYTTLNSPECYR